MERIITLRVQRREDWPADARLLLYVGTENAADLAASTPAGGTEVMDEPVWPERAEMSGFGRGSFGEGRLGTFTHAFGFGHGEFGRFAFGESCTPRRTLRYRYDAVDPCADLPVGVKVSAAGNVSSVAETVVTFAQTPRPVTRFTVGPGSMHSVAKLTWTASPDIN